MKAPYSWHSANVCCCGTEVLKYVLEIIQKNPSGNLPNLKNIQTQYYLKIKCSLLKYLHNITLSKLLPFHDLHTVGFGSHWLLPELDCPAIMTAFAGFFLFIYPFSNSSVFLCFCIFLFTTPVEKTYSFFPVKCWTLPDIASEKIIGVEKLGALPGHVVFMQILLIPYNLANATWWILSPPSSAA